MLRMFAVCHVTFISLLPLSPTNMYCKAYKYTTVFLVYPPCQTNILEDVKCSTDEY